MTQFTKELIKNYKTKSKCKTCIDNIIYNLKRCEQKKWNGRCLLRTSFLNIKIKKVKRF